MTKFFERVVFALCLALLAACDDEETPDCTHVADPCGTAEELRCAAGGGAIEACQEDAVGCLEWTVEAECGDAQTCSPEGDAPVCVCASECDDGDSRCDGNVVQTCDLGDDDCLVWTDGADCGDDGQVCDTVEDEALCVSECTDDCSEDDDPRCDGFTVQTCDVGDNGCLAWVDGIDCSDGGWHCDDDDGSAECVPGCEDACTAAGDTRCAADVIETCAEGDDGCLAWDAGTDCADDGQYCDATAGDAICVDVCVDQCLTEGASTCEGDVITACAMGEDGCLDLVPGTDCAVEADYCDDSTGAPLCASCVDGCATEGASRCADSFVMSCVADEHGCLSWQVGTDCSAALPPLSCEDASGEALCVDSYTGESCDVPLFVVPPHVEEGIDFFDEYDDDFDIVGPGCFGIPVADEAVFEVDLLAGDELVVQETSMLIATLSLQAGCGGTERCLLSVSDEYGLTAQLRYVAEVDERVFITVEAATGMVWRDFEIHFDLATPEVCSGGLDEDVDGLVDCDDPECFGLPPCDAAETNCVDGADNDGDAQIDCADTDCDSVSACMPYEGVYQIFEGTWLDLGGAAITFTPDAGAPHGYLWSVASGVTGLAVAPGSGATSTALELTDDDFAEYDLAHLPGFELYGVTYASLFVGSNGLITFGRGSTSFTPSLEELFRLPTIAALHSDLNPSATGAGAVTVDEDADRVVVSFQGVPFYGGTETNEFQAILGADGTIELVYPRVVDSGGRNVAVGLSAGPGVPPYPPATDFVAPVPEVCTDGTDNNFDGLVDCADPTCFGPPDCAVEDLCGDLADNDLDTFVDCDDPDCGALPSCAPLRGVWQMFDVGEPNDLAGASISFTPDAGDPSGYTWVSGAGVTGFPIEPGTGAVSRTLALIDESDEEWVLSTMVAFPFFGVDYDRLYVVSNGYLTFGEHFISYGVSPEECFAATSVMGLRRDYDPMVPTTAGVGVVTVDEFADQLVVTFENVALYGAAGVALPNSFQIVLGADGAIDLYVVAVDPAENPAATGLSSGGTGVAPAETNFVP